MKKIFGVILAVLMVFTAGSAFAASTLFNGVDPTPAPPPTGPFWAPHHNVQYLACELIDPVNGYAMDIHSIGAFATAGIGFVAGANLPMGTTVTVHLENAEFTAPAAGWNHRIMVFDPTTMQPLPVTGTPTSGGAFSDFATFTITNPVTAGELVSLVWAQELVPGIWSTRQDFPLLADGDLNMGGDVNVSLDCSINAADATSTLFQRYGH